MGIMQSHARDKKLEMGMPHLGDDVNEEELAAHERLAAREEPTGSYAEDVAMADDVEEEAAARQINHTEWD